MRISDFSNRFQCFTHGSHSFPIRFGHGSNTIRSQTAQPYERRTWTAHSGQNLIPGWPKINVWLFFSRDPVFLMYYDVNGQPDSILVTTRSECPHIWGVYRWITSEEPRYRKKFQKKFFPPKNVPSVVLTNIQHFFNFLTSAWPSTAIGTFWSTLTH